MYRQIPIIRLKGIQRSIVHGKHHVGIGWLALVIHYLECPLLCGTRLGIVAEGLPVHVQFVVRQSFAKDDVLGIYLATAHVRSRQTHAIGIGIFVGNGHLVQTILQHHHSIHHHLIAGKAHEEDVHGLMTLVSELQQGRRIAIKRVCRALHPILCL